MTPQPLSQECQTDPAVSLTALNCCFPKLWWQPQPLPNLFASAIYPAWNAFSFHPSFCLIPLQLPQDPAETLNFSSLTNFIEMDHVHRFSTYYLPFFLKTCPLMPQVIVYISYVYISSFSIRLPTPWGQVAYLISYCCIPYSTCHSTWYVLLIHWPVHQVIAGQTSLIYHPQQLKASQKFLSNSFWDVVLAISWYCASRIASYFGKNSLLCPLSYSTEKLSLLHVLVEKKIFKPVWRAFL